MKPFAEIIFEKNSGLDGQTALVDRNGHRHTAWSQLWENACRVAAYAQDKGISGIVPIRMARCSEAVAAMLGLSLAGIGIAPLSEKMPDARGKMIAAETGNAIFTMADYESAMRMPPEAFAPVADSAEPAYVVYTSGSTGTPKGVMLSGDAFVRSIARSAGSEIFNFQPSDIALQTVSFSFAALLVDLFAPLYAGIPVHILPEDARNDVVLMTGYINAHGITTMFITPAPLSLLSDTPSLRVVCVAGERLSDFKPRGYRLLNCYGMTETSGIVVRYPVEAAMENTPIGKPCADFRCYVLDEDGQESDEGELCLSGVIASGYYNLPDLTRQTFTPNPFSREAGHETLLHTGDIVRKLPDGNLIFLNRRDFMLKINGQRVEPGEAEAALRRIEGIRSAAVKGFTEPDGRSYLCAYYTAERKIDEDALRSELGQSLPSYMIPSFYMRLESLPLNANNKLDRGALLPPSSAALQSAYEEAGSEAEAILCRAFEEALKLEHVGVNDDFLHLGGDSIRAMAVVRAASPLHLRAVDVLSGRTPRGIAALAASVWDEAYGNLPENLSVAPLTSSQMGIYLECAAQPTSTMYNTPLHLSFARRKDMTPSSVKAAVDAVLGLHPALLSSIVTEGEEVLMVRGKMPENGICTAEEADEDTPETAERSFVRPFVLSESPLCRACALLTPNEVHILLDIHHIVSDGSSAALLMRQICAKLAGNAAEKETVDAFALYEAEKRINAAEDIQKAKKHFNLLLSGNETDSNLLFDRKPCNEGAAPAKRVEYPLELSGLTAYLKENELTESTFFMGVFGYALAKMTGQTESLFAAVESGRKSALLDKTVSMLVRTLPVTMDIDEEKDAAVLLSDLQTQFFASIQNDSCSFGELAGEYGIKSDVMFAYQGDMLSDFESPLGRVTIKRPETGAAFANLSLSVYKKENGYVLNTEYRSDCYSPTAIDRFLRLFDTAAHTFLKDAPLKSIPLLNDKDRGFLDGLNNNSVPYNHDETIVDMFRRTAASCPDKTAAVFRDKRYSYARLDEISDRIAGHIRSLGIGRGQVVSILIPRCEYMVSASLGVLKAGAMYQPLDPTYPPERLNFMCKDADAKLLIADRALLPILTDYSGPVLFTDEITTLPAAAPDFAPPKPEDGFILLYTSGTTGTPKGCVLTHGNLSALIHACSLAIGLDGNSRSAAYASYGFDANIGDTYPALAYGGEVHIIPEELRLDLPAIREYCETNGITHIMMTTQVGRQFAEEYPELQSLKSLLLGGEKLVPLAPPRSYRLINGYGPTECTMMTSFFCVDGLYESLPIGRALANTRLYVTDGFGRRVPVGVPGELVISGPQVGKGYLNRPEQTEKAFVANTYEENPGSGYTRCYRTGDIVRFLDDGNVEFIGRRDMQVKIRGFRIELSEVERVIRAYPDIRDATVVARDDPSGGKCIHAYVVSDKAVDIVALHRFIRERKPPYMVPAATMQIEKIPLTPNMKVDKRALPPIVRPAAKTDYCRSLTKLEEELGAILREIVGHGDFDVQTEFADMGVTSIASIRLAVQLYKKYGLPITSKEILSGGSILSVENRIVSSLLENVGGKTEESPRPLRQSYPLTETQTGIYLDCLRAGMEAYSIPMLLKLPEEIDEARLARAIRDAVRAHPSMLCCIHPDESGDAAMYPRPDMSAELTEETVTALPPKQTRFSFSEAPLFCFRLIRFGAERYLFIEMHHIISDGSSMTVLLRDIDCAYRGEPLSAGSYTAFDLAAEEQTARAGQTFEQAKEYYDSVFRGVSADYLPAADRASALSHGYGEYALDVKAEEVGGFCRRIEISEATFFTGVFALTLARYTAHEDALFATVHNGRTDPRTERLVSMLVKTLPVYIETEAEASVASFFHALDERLRLLRQNDLYSFADAARDHGVTADIMFVYQGRLLAGVTLNGQKLEQIPVELPAIKAALSAELLEEDDTFCIRLEYNGGRYSTEWAESFADAYSVCLTNLMKSEKLGEADICSQKALDRFASFNDTAWDVKYRPAYRFIEERAVKHPDRIAVVAAGEELTYRQLDHMANALARLLQENGILPGSAVEIIVERTKEIYVAEIGILKAGCAFLCLSPGYPDERIRFVSEDVGACAIVTTHSVAKRRSELLDALGLPVLFADDIDINTEAESLGLDIAPDELSYLIYTSGSTGKPKGVMLTQRGLVNLFDPNPKNSHTTGFADGNAISTAVTAFTFDASIMEGLVSLANGSTVCIAGEEEIHDPEALRRLCLKNHVTAMLGTPSFLLSLLDYPDFADVIRQLRSIVAGGEVFPSGLYEKLRELNPDLLIINGYGPSEATFACSCKFLTSGENITVGTPLANTAIYCVDKQNHILPMGALGEMTVLGDGVGRGYIGRDDLTKKSYITLMGKPAYKTGDLALITHSGEIEFHGRIDNQVKLRGLRVELGEIETAINACDGVKSSIVIVKGDEHNPFLAAYFTAIRPVAPEEITAQLSCTLADYMVPRAIMQLDEMPLTANGKIDKKALPDIRPVRKPGGKRAPKNALEEKILELFRSVLGVEECFADDNFFEIGGTSLSASKVVMQLKSDGCKVEYQDIFDHQTAEALSDYLEPVHTDAVKAHSPQPEASLAVQNNAISELLLHNTVDYAAQVKRESLGDILLTGASGFLGIHILKELIDSEQGDIICLMRRGRYDNAAARLKAALVYYFEDDFAEAFRSRITVLEGDITDDDLSGLFRDISFDTVINCAASVKHYAKDDSIEFVNVHGTENLIVLAKEKRAKMIQISTTSVPGAHNEQTYRANLKMAENQLFVVDDMNNQYVQSKYHAELRMLNAMREGMRGKIIRVGNLMGRYSDGEFQTNMRTNAFLNGLRGFVSIGKCPVSHATDPISFSPVDCTARAVVLLAGTNDIFTAFNADSRSSFDEMKLIDAVNRCGIAVRPVSDEEYYEDFYRMMGDQSMNEKVSALLTNDRPDMHMLETDNRFTANVLYRLGFSWPFIDDAYLERVIKGLDTLDFFS